MLLIISKNFSLEPRKSASEKQYNLNRMFETMLNKRQQSKEKLSSLQNTKIIWLLIET